MAPRKLSPKAQAKHDDARVSSAYHRTCSNIEIPMMQILKISAIGRESIAAGDDDETLGQKIRAYVETIRTR